jgi:hypothetical protein
MSRKSRMRARQNRYRHLTRRSAQDAFSKTTHSPKIKAHDLPAKPAPAVDGTIAM